MNASDERGINVIREKIKTFAKYSANDINPPWKLIILDEADTMTNDSQFALRRIMEQYSKVTRFCIICNYHNKIIDPIVSRCALFRFKPISSEQMISRMETIANRENWQISKELLLKIQSISRGDMRRAINLLQKCFITDDNLNVDNILDEISGIIPDKFLDNLFNYILKKDSINVDKIMNEIFSQGYSLVNQIIRLHNWIIGLNIDDKIKANILIKLAEVDQSLIKGSDEYIQFVKFVYYIMVTI
jgi:replication factor C subunit 2/4